MTVHNSPYPFSKAEEKGYQNHKRGWILPRGLTFFFRNLRTSSTEAVQWITVAALQCASSEKSRQCSETLPKPSVGYDCAKWRLNSASFDVVLTKKRITILKKHYFCIQIFLYLKSIWTQENCLRVKNTGVELLLRGGSNLLRMILRLNRLPNYLIRISFATGSPLLTRMWLILFFRRRCL